ncbi:hypothetical protein [Marmoricola sp. RAF53]|uniref:hypothetical protein n=1 Tax=Marmoricola sp. RAF53 TaxID=3233059 RepID=UPI003F992A15
MRAARRLLATLSEENRGFVALTVVAELHWVLSRSFRLPAEQVARAFDLLMASSEIDIEDGESVGEALEHARAGEACASEVGDDHVELSAQPP